MKVCLQKMVSFLDKTLALERFDDVSNNGLQVENSGTVDRVLCGVDASLRALRYAADMGATLLVCHHGLSWGDSLKRINGLNYKLVSFAIRHDIAIYAAHLPLDAHPVYGNNAQLCKLLGLKRLQPAFSYHGNTIGFMGELPKPVPFETFCAAVRAKIAPEIRTLDFGAKLVRKVGVVSGGAAEDVEQAYSLGLDTFLTGEPGLIGYTAAENLGMNAVFAGHYATERFGVAALGGLLQRKFRLPVSLIDFSIPY